MRSEKVGDSISYHEKSPTAQQPNHAKNHHRYPHSRFLDTTIPPNEPKEKNPVHLKTENQTIKTQSASDHEHSEHTIKE